jgi:hypothetical protein
MGMGASAATRLVLVVGGALVLAGCGPAAAPPSPTPTPLPAALLQERYLAAATVYDSAERPIAEAENTYCPAEKPSAELAQCEHALSADRLATVAFDDAVRQLRFPSSAQSDVNRLLADDAQLAALLQQASTAPSLTAVAALTPQILTLLSASAHDAATVRTAIGLPASSPSPSPS